MPLTFDGSDKRLYCDVLNWSVVSPSGNDVKITFCVTERDGGDFGSSADTAAGRSINNLKEVLTALARRSMYIALVAEDGMGSSGSFGLTDTKVHLSMDGRDCMGSLSTTITGDMVDAMWADLEASLPSILKRVAAEPARLRAEAASWAITPDQEARMAVGILTHNREADMWESLASAAHSSASPPSST